MANAELIERGDLFVKFQGDLAPQALPRSGVAPISVKVDGTIKTLSGEKPPALRFIAIAINRGGRVDTEGLPICRRSQIDPATSAEALAACGPALVGRGRYRAAVALPEQESFPLQGKILAFNAVDEGERVVLAHVFGRYPISSSRVIVFRIHRTKGTFGNVLTAGLPPRVNRYGYLKRIKLELHREYIYRGRKHSYLSAACAAPKGLNSAIFPFVRASMAFADGRKLHSTIIRTCNVER